jgi:hypothetical protein
MTRKLIIPYFLSDARQKNKSSNLLDLTCAAFDFWIVLKQYLL